METISISSALAFAHFHPDLAGEPTHVRMLLEELRVEVERAYESSNYIVPPGVFEAVLDNSIYLAGKAGIRLEFVSIAGDFEGPLPRGTELVSGPAERLTWLDHLMIDAYDHTTYGHVYGQEMLLRNADRS